MRQINLTDLTGCWCEIFVCEADRHRSQFAPSQPSPSPLAGPSDGRRTRCAPPPSAWITTNHPVIEKANRCEEERLFKIPIITVYTHAKKNVVLGTHAKVLPNGAQFGADVFAEDVGRPRGGRKQPRQDGPLGKMKLKIEYNMFF